MLTPAVYKPAIDHHLIEASRVMSAAVSVHLESASPLIDVPTVRDPEIRRVDGSVHHKPAYIAEKKVAILVKQ